MTLVAGSVQVGHLLETTEMSIVCPMAFHGLPGWYGTAVWTRVRSGSGGSEFSRYVQYTARKAYSGQNAIAQFDTKICQNGAHMHST